MRPSYGARGEEILDGGGGRRRRERNFLSFTSLPNSLPFFPFSPETPDTQATYHHFLASRETMASDPEGQLSDQSDIPANSEVSEIVINCVVSKDNL